MFYAEMEKLVPCGGLFNKDHHGTDLGKIRFDSHIPILVGKTVICNGSAIALGLPSWGPGLNPKRTIYAASSIYSQILYHIAILLRKRQQKQKRGQVWPI